MSTTRRRQIDVAFGAPPPLRSVRVTVTPPGMNQPLGDGAVWVGVRLGGSFLPLERYDANAKIAFDVSVPAFPGSSVTAVGSFSEDLYRASATGTGAR